MEYIFPVLLTVVVFYYIIKLLNKIEKKVLKNNVYRQSDMHNIIKPFISKKPQSVDKKTQMDKMLEESSVRVIVVDNKAYWVLQNVFYTAEFVNGDVDPETTRPIDTSNMSKADMDKMLFILDKLGDGNNSDSGGTR